MKGPPSESLWKNPTRMLMIGQEDGPPVELAPRIPGYWLKWPSEGIAVPCPAKFAGFLHSLASG